MVMSLVSVSVLLSSILLPLISYLFHFSAGHHKHSFFLPLFITVAGPRFSDLTGDSFTITDVQKQVKLNLKKAIYPGETE